MSTACHLLKNMSCPSPGRLLTVQMAATVYCLPRHPHRQPLPRRGLAYSNPDSPQTLSALPFLLAFLTHSGSLPPYCKSGTGPEPWFDTPFLSKASFCRFTRSLIGSQRCINNGQSDVKVISYRVVYTKVWAAVNTYLLSLAHLASVHVLVTTLRRVFKVGLVWIYELLWSWCMCVRHRCTPVCLSMADSVLAS